MSIRLVHNLDDLAADLEKVGRDFRPGADKLVGEVAREGNEVAKGIARAKYRRGHARKYPGTFSASRAGILKSVYGPRASGQGLLASILERGSRNNAAHHNLDQSADIIGPEFARRAVEFADSLFWPGGDR